MENIPLQPNIDTNRLKLIRLASITALTGNLVLSSLKLIVGALTGTLAVLADGLDSAGDVAISCMTLAVSFIISRPSDKEHPWGHGRAETTGTMVLSFVIFFAGAQLTLAAAKSLFTFFRTAPETALPPISAVIVSFVSIGGKLALTYSQYVLGKKANSAMISANAKNMLSDVVISVSVFTGILCALIFKFPVLDPVAAFFVGVWIMKNGIAIFLEMNTELMDGNTDKLLYRQLFDAVRSVDGVTNPHRARIRKIASCWDIDLDIELPPDMSVLDAHKKAEEVGNAVRKSIANVYDIVIHVEPKGLGEKYPQEGFGLCEADIYSTEANRRDVF